MKARLEVCAITHAMYDTVYRALISRYTHNVGASRVTVHRSCAVISLCVMCGSRCAIGER